MVCWPPHAADVLDVAARHWLAVRDDRQRFISARRIARWPLGFSGPVLAHLRPALQAPAAGQCDQFDAFAFAIMGNFVRAASAACRGRARRRTAYACRAAASAGRADQRRLEDAFGIQGIHVFRLDPRGSLRLNSAAFSRLRRVRTSVCPDGARCDRWSGDAHCVGPDSGSVDPAHFCWPYRADGHFRLSEAASTRARKECTIVPKAPQSGLGCCCRAPQKLEGLRKVRRWCRFKAQSIAA